MDIPKDMQDKLTRLRKAVDSREAEAICLAYLALRKSAATNGVQAREMFELADRALSRPAANVIICAFAHRHCPMCQDGMTECEDCEGAGVLNDGRNCLACDGIGMTSCDFCRGTGWAPPAMMAPEIAPGIRKKQQFVDVEKDLADLKPIMLGSDGRKEGRLTTEQRRSLQRWAMRLRARLNSLIHDEDLDLNTEEKKRLLQAVGELDAYLATLRNVHAGK